jgi:hypothetical protein
MVGKVEIRNLCNFTKGYSKYSRSNVGDVMVKKGGKIKVSGWNKREGTKDNANSLGFSSEVVCPVR